MKMVLLLIFSIILYHESVCQKNVQQVIDAENAFAAYAIQHNTKEAFLAFMDSSAVVFDNGIVNNAQSVWINKPANSSKLIWKPAFAGISSSGELAFTAGPWELKKDLDDTLIASGQFATIWTKTGNGKWKFLADIGISFSPSVYNKIKTVKVLGNGSSTLLRTRADVLKMENNFIDEFNKKGNAAFMEAADNQIWILMQGIPPFQGKLQLKEAISAIPGQMKFIPIEGSISASGDMAYVYGTIKYNSKEENYLRVWQHKINGWKIVLQVIK